MLALQTHLSALCLPEHTIPSIIMQSGNSPPHQGPKRLSWGRTTSQRASQSPPGSSSTFSSDGTASRQQESSPCRDQQQQQEPQHQQHSPPGGEQQVKRGLNSVREQLCQHTRLTLPLLRSSHARRYCGRCCRRCSANQALRRWTTSSSPCRCVETQGAAGRRCSNAPTNAALFLRPSAWPAAWLPAHADRPGCPAAQAVTAV
jgi:hypothetical protein